VILTCWNHRVIIVIIELSNLLKLTHKHTSKMYPPSLPPPMGDTMTTTRTTSPWLLLTRSTATKPQSSSHPKSNPSRSHARPVSVQKSTHSCGHYCSDAPPPPPPPPSRNLWPAASRILASREDLTNANRWQCCWENGGQRKALFWYASRIRARGH